jgi:hypothetical protein
MQNNRSDPSAVPGDPKLTEQTLLKETDLQRSIESLQRIICDLLIENEKLRQHLIAEKSLSCDTAHRKARLSSQTETEDLSCCHRASHSFQP